MVSARNVITLSTGCDAKTNPCGNTFLDIVEASELSMEDTGFLGLVIRTKFAKNNSQGRSGWWDPFLVQVLKVDPKCDRMPLAREVVMPKAYSMDLRERVLDAYLANEESIDDVASRFDINRSTVVKWAQLYRQTGSVAPRESKRGPPSTVTPAQLKVLRKIIDRRPDLTYEEITERWNRALGTNRHRSTTVRAVLGLGYTLKKRR